MSYIQYKLHQISSSKKMFRKSFINENSDTIFMPGCSLSAYNPQIVINIYNYLKYHIKDIGITLSCCYKPSIMIKDNNTFKRNYKKLDEMLNENNIKTIITACPNCYKTITKNSTNVKVVFLLDTIKEIGIDNSFINYYGDINIIFSIHDSCAIRGEKSIYESSRYLLNKLGIKYNEFNKNMENSMCCGAIFTDSKKRIEQLNKRVSQSNSDYIISYCETCVKSMKSVGKNSIHILDLLFNEEIIKKNIFIQVDNSSFNSWVNRYKLNNRRNYD